MDRSTAALPSLRTLDRASELEAQAGRHLMFHRVAAAAHDLAEAVADIEVQAAGAVYGAARDSDRPLLMGSVKTDIGHTESASGAAGLIKVVLSLEHEELPKHLNFRNPSPHIPWDRIPVRVVAPRPVELAQPVPDRSHPPARGSSRSAACGR